MKLTVKLTQRDIRNGNPQKAGSCPIALAVKRTLGQINHGVSMKVSDVKIRTGAGSFVLDGVEYGFSNNMKVKSIVRKVDNDDHPKRGVRPTTIVIMADPIFVKAVK